MDYARALELDPEFARRCSASRVRPTGNRRSRSSSAPDAAGPLDGARAAPRRHRSAPSSTTIGKRRCELAKTLHAKYPGDIRASRCWPPSRATSAARATRRSSSTRSFSRSIRTTPTAYNQHRLLLRLPWRLREGDREPPEVPVHGAGPGESVRQPRRDSGLLRPLRRGDRESEQGARDQARLLSRVRAPGRGLRGKRRLPARDRDATRRPPTSR